MTSNPILKDVSDTDPAGIKEVRIKLKNDAYILGLTLQSVMNQVRSGFFGFQAQRFQRGQDEIKVWVRYEKEDRSSIRNLDDMWISTPIGNKVPFQKLRLMILHVEMLPSIIWTEEEKFKSPLIWQILRKVPQM